jgi:hypothetical protein
MTFEDIIGGGGEKPQGGVEKPTGVSGTTPGTVLPTNGYICPVCSSDNVSKGGLFMGLDDLWRQYVECNVCKNNWMVVFSEDQSTCWIDNKA